ncbi:hypothetical protein NFI96_006832 [Prochilodus magdalenae]|nr:hypothetical protein NFI96_006832 [Prochilodus magdalenae]
MKFGGNPCPYIVEDPNEDTISVLVRLITEKKENAAALEELLQEYERKQMAVSKATAIKFPVLPHLHQFRSLPRLCTHQHHLHTINGLAPRSGLCCSRCSQKKWPELLLPPLSLTNDPQKTPCSPTKPLPADCTILSVGRFQVAQIPEGNSVSVATTPAESSDTDSVESGNTEPADERSLLSVSTSSNSASSKPRQEASCPLPVTGIIITISIKDLQHFSTCQQLTGVFVYRLWSGAEAVVVAVERLRTSVLVSVYCPELFLLVSASNPVKSLCQESQIWDQGGFRLSFGELWSRYNSGTLTAYSVSAYVAGVGGRAVSVQDLCSTFQ